MPRAGVAQGGIPRVEAGGGPVPPPALSEPCRDPVSSVCPSPAPAPWAGDPPHTPNPTLLAEAQLPPHPAPLACLPEPPKTHPAPPGPGVSPRLRARTCSSGDSTRDRALQLRGWHRGQRRAPGPSRVVSHLGAVGQEWECWECWDAAGAGSVSPGDVAEAVLPASRRLLAVPWGSLSCQGPCPGWDSLHLQAGCPRGTFPAGGAKRCSLLGAPLPLPGEWDQTSPGMRVPSACSHTGLGQAWDSGPPGATRSLQGLLCTGHTPRPPSGLSSLPNLPGCPLCGSACAQPGGRRGAAPVPVLVPVPAPLSPCCCCPSVPGGLSVQNRLLQPPHPSLCDLGGPQRAPWGHWGPPATQDPPAPQD